MKADDLSYAGAIKAEKLRGWVRGEDLERGLDGVVATATAAAQGAATDADAARLAAEDARDAASASAVLYADEATGRGFVADQEYFRVVGDGDVAVYLYRRVNASASTLISALPSKTFVETAPTKANLRVGKNLFNKSAADVSIGYFPSHITGAIVANAAYNTSGFVPIKPSTAYTISQKHYLVWYNAAKAYISGTSSADTAQTATSPAGAVYARFSATTGNWDLLQFEEGSAVTSYEPYALALPLTEVRDRSIGSAKIADRAVTPDKVNFMTPGKNLLNVGAMLAGNMMNAAGVITVNASYSVSDFIAVTPGANYVATIGVNHHCYFNAARSPIAGGANTVTTAFTVPAGAAFIRLSMQNVNLPGQQFEAGTVATAFEAFNQRLVLSDGTPIVPQLLAGSISSPVIASKAVTPSKVSFLRNTKNLFNKSAVLLDSQAGANGNINPGDYNLSDLIPVTPGTTYNMEGGSRGARFVAFYTSGGAATPGGSNTDLTSIVAPAGASFMRVTVYKSDMESFQVEEGAAKTGYTAFGYVLDQDVDGTPIFAGQGSSATASTWANKAWASMADSLGNSGWQSGVVARHGLVWTNFATGGSRISGPVGSETAMCQDARINAIPTTTDLVTVLGGMNDWAQDVPLGDPTSADSNQFFGGLNLMIEKLLTRLPNARIVLLTTPHGQLYSRASPPRSTWPNDWTNNVGLKSIEYGEAIRVACRRWGIPFIDTALCGWNQFNIDSFVLDDGGRLHPDPATGGRRISEIVSGGLASIAPLA